MRFQVRLVITFFSVLLVVVLASTFWLVERLRDDLRANMQEELTRYVTTARHVLESDAFDGTREEMDRFCGELRDSIDARFTIVAESGEVLGDSDVVFRDLSSLDNHAERAEVRQAFREGLGVSSRLSATVKRELIYVAVPFVRGDTKYVVRVAKDTDAVEASVGRLSQPGYYAVLIALALALFLSVVVSSLLSRDLKSLGKKLWKVRAPKDLASTGGVPENEFLFIEKSIDSMAKELDDAIAELVRERDRLGEVIEAMHAAVVVSNVDNVVMIANRSAREMFQRGNPMDGRNLGEEVRVPVILDAIRSASELRSERFEFEMSEPHARDCVARMSRPPSSGGLILVVHDVTELRRLEKVRRDLVANVSHELRTPVSVIRANTETLLEGALNDPDAAHTFLGAIDRSSKRLAAILRDLLDLARIESGTMTLSRAEVDFHLLCESVVTSFATAAGERGLTLSSEVPPLTVVHGDPGALEQVMTNYVENAVKYTPDGGAIVITAGESDGYFRAEVCDTGTGIAPDFRERVFERFFRVDMGRSRALGGTGLGLSIVKNLVGRMGGDVGVQQGEGGGAIFYFEIPLRHGPKGDV